MAPASPSSQPPAHSGRFTFVEWDKDQPTNRSLSTQHVTREIRRQKRLQQQELARKSQAQSPSKAPGPPTASPSSAGSNRSQLPTPPIEQPSTIIPSRVPTSKASGRVGKSTKSRKKPGAKPILTSKSANEQSDQPTRKSYGISIWQLLSEGDIDPRPDSPLQRHERKPSFEGRPGEPVGGYRYLPPPLDPLTSYRRNALMGVGLTSPGDYNLLDYWLATAPQMLHLDIFPPSQQHRKPTHEIFFPMASRAVEAMEDVIMLPAALAWAKASPPSAFVTQMLNVHRMKCVQFLNTAIQKLVDQQIMEEHTHIGLMSLIWAENMYGDAQQAQAYSLVFREMVQLRRKQNLVPTSRAPTVMAHWYNAMTTVNFWPKGSLKQKEMVDAESLLRPMFPFLESVRFLAYERKFTTASATDRHKYLAPTSPLTIILLSADPFNSTSSSSIEARGERYIHFRMLLLFRVLLFLHVGLLGTSSFYGGPTMLSIFFDKIEWAIRDMDILSSPSPLALLLWAMLNDPGLSTVDAHRTVAMWIYPVRRLKLEWLERLNKLLLVWLGLPVGDAKEAATHYRPSETTVNNIELDSLPDMLMDLVIQKGSTPPDGTANDNGQQGSAKREFFPQTVK